MDNKKAIVTKNRLRNKTCDNCKFFEKQDDIDGVKWANVCRYVFHSSAIPKEETCENWRS